MKDKTSSIMKSLELYKDYDLYYRGLLNDCYNHIEDLQAEVDRLAMHNQQLLQVIYQNQSQLESAE